MKTYIDDKIDLLCELCVEFTPSEDQAETFKKTSEIIELKNIIMNYISDTEYSAAMNGDLKGIKQKYELGDEDE